MIFEPRPHSLLRCGAALLALVISEAAGFGQVAPPVLSPADPTKKNVPAEIVPPKPEMRPAPGEKTIGENGSSPSPSPGSKPPPPRSEPALNSLIGSLPEADLEQILSVLKQRYVTPLALAEPELKRATVQGLLERLGTGAAIVAAARNPPDAGPFRSEILEGRAGYARLGAVSRENLPELDRALQEFSEKNLAACVLDLRATVPGADFEQAAEICRRFCPKGKVLFHVQRPGAQEQIFTSKSDPKYRGLLVVLQDADTAGGAEIVAGVLRALANGIVIGQQTKGEAAEFAEAPLSGGRTLRFAVAEARLADGQSILAGGVTPDLPVEMPADAVAAVLKQELEKGVAPLLVEPERLRMNEAALVAGTNPEIDALQAAQRLRGERPKPILRDQMLLRALDLVTSIGALKRPE